MANRRASGSSRRVGPLAIGVPLRVAIYYALLAIAVTVAVRWLPRTH